jgi:hypothetical protein
LYLRKTLSQTDWDSYISVYSIPSIFLVGPPNASEEKQKEYQAVAGQILSNGRGFLPHDSDIKFEFSPGLTRETKQVVDDAVALNAAGFSIDPSELSEKTGYTLTRSKSLPISDL